MKPTAEEFALVLIERYRADHKAQESYSDPKACKLAQITLDAFMRNVATELHQRFGFSLEGIPPERSTIHTGAKLPTPHDKGSAPPAGFTRYQIEIDVPDDCDSSALLGQAQEFAIALLETYEVGEINGGEDDDEETEKALSERISDRVSVQRMEG